MKTNPQRGMSGATDWPVFGHGSVYMETSANNSGSENVFVSSERTDIIRISNISFYYNRFSFLANNTIRSRGRFSFQPLLSNLTWSTRYKKINKDDRYSNSSTQWKLTSLNFQIGIYCIELIYDQIDTQHAGVCLCKNTITRSAF